MARIREKGNYRILVLKPEAKRLLGNVGSVMLG
jgi:hypothetical protein